MLSKLHIIFQVVLWVASVSFAAGTYFHTQATVNEKVEKVEERADVNSKILCQMAIGLNVKEAVDICTREIFR